MVAAICAKFTSFSISDASKYSMALLGSLGKFDGGYLGL